ncbi:MAG TPA: pitrilysin family protein [Moraxellaceae bacterium]|nr:pitrilysin family protein [Moraxellaceae bacterium]
MKRQVSRYSAILFALPMFLTGASALAGHEGATVAPGPVTSLERLESVRDLPALPQSRRPFVIQHWLTHNGTRVYFVEADELPMLDVRLVFDAGGARDGDHGGLASLANRMLDDGTSSRDASAVAGSFESVGARYSAGSYRDMAVAELRVLSDPAFRDPALDVLADVIAHASYPEDAYRREMKSSEVGQQQQEQSPAALASRLFFKGLYGDHPYAHPPTGTRESLAKISRDDLVAFHARYYVARNLTLALVGAISRADAEMIAERISGALPEGQPAPPLPAVQKLDRARHLYREFPSAQTHILMGAPGIRYGDPDYFALMVGNEILGGGGFTSRLMEELRQRRGMTYGAYSNFQQMRAEGPFQISVSTRADQTADALRVIREIVTGFVKDGPSDEELRAAKANIIGSFPLSTASNDSIIGFLGAIGFYGLPLDYLDTYIAKVNAVTTDDVRAAFRRHVRPDRLLIVTVGQGKP